MQLQLPIDSIVGLYAKQKKFDKIQKKFTAIKAEYQQKIIAYMKQENVREISIEPSMLDGVPLSVKRITQKKVQFDLDKLKKSIDKELLNEIVDKTYTINDIDGLVKYLKSYGVNPKKFKTYLSVEEKVNQKKMNQLSEFGDISFEDIKGCYTVYENEGYLKFVETANGDKNE